jgi:RNA polymerase sigma-70 factor, ECF subfamily
LERTDAELVEAACGGDVASFRELYERHYRMAVGIAHSRLADPHLAEDAAQEAFAVVCRRLTSLRDGRRFGQWLGTICRRTANRLRRTKANYAVFDDIPTDETASNGDARETARVRAAVESLEASAREVVMLHYFSGLSYEQISQTLGISTQSVHGRLQRARRALGRALSKNEE